MEPIAATQSSVPCPTNNLSCILEGKLTLHQSAVSVVCSTAMWTVAYTMFSFAPLTFGSRELHKNELTATKFSGVLYFTWLESYATRKNRDIYSEVQNQIPMVRWSCVPFFSALLLSLSLLSIGPVHLKRFWDIKEVSVREHFGPLIFLKEPNDRKITPNQPYKNELRKAKRVAV